MAKYLSQILDETKARQGDLFKSKQHPAHGDKRDYPKRDIFVDGKYHGSTTWARTHAEAEHHFLKAYPQHAGKKIRVVMGEGVEIELDEDMISEVSEHDLMTRPDLHTAREHFKTAIHHSRKHSELVHAAHQKYGDGNGSNISGIHREHYPEHVKNELRHHAKAVTHHEDLGMAAKPKGVRHSTMLRLGQTVAKHHGPTGFYGFQPRNEEVDDLDAIYDSEVLTEEHEEHDAHHLVLHADNDSHLYHSSHIPVVKNLEKKWRKGIYDPEKAKKLWKYHADRAAQSYHKEHGDPHSKWHHAFSPATRHAAAAHWEKHHRSEMEAGNFHDH